MPRRHPTRRLTPDTDPRRARKRGPAGDGRLLALNSYENRVYLVDLRRRASGGREVLPPGTLDRRADPGGARVRRRAGRARDSGRRADRHATARTLHQVRGLPLRRLSEVAAGARRNWTTRRRCEWMGRFIGRLHAVGAIAPFATRPTLDIATFGDEPRAFLLAHDFVPRRPASRPIVRCRKWRWRACATASRAPATSARCACTATATRATCCGRTRRPALRRLRRRAHGPGRAGPVDAAVRRPRGDDAPARRRARRLRGFPRFRPARAAPGRGAAHAAPDPLRGVDRAALGRPGVSRPHSRGSTRSATGRTASSNCASRSRRWTNHRWSWVDSHEWVAD